jgi:hypothetical protein
LKLSLIDQRSDFLVVQVLELRKGEFKPLIRHDILDGDVQMGMREHGVDSSLDKIFHPITADLIPGSLFQLTKLLSRRPLKLLVEFRSYLGDVVATLSLELL